MKSVFLLCAIMLCGPPAGLAQDSRLIQTTADSFSISLPQVISRLFPETILMVETQNQRRQKGHFLEARHDSLFLHEYQNKIGLPLSEIEALWTRGRAMKTGTIVGGITGAIGLGIYLSLLCDFAASETGEEGHIWGCALAGGVLGAAGGGILGGVIGAAIPRWNVRYRATDFSSHPSNRQQNQYPKTHDSFQRIGSLHLLLGYARNATSGVSDGSWGGRVNLWTIVNRHWALGPEFGYYGKLQAEEIAGPPGSGYSYVPDAHLWHAGGSVRFTARQGTIQPFGTAGLGYYSWEQNYAAYNIAAGISFQLGSSLHSFEAEARWHQNLQNLAGPSPKFFTLMLGMGTAW